MNYDNRREPVITADNVKESKEAVVGENVTIGYSADNEGMRHHNDVVTHERPASIAAVNDQDTSRQSAVNAAEAVMLLAAAVSASYSDEAAYSQQGTIMNPQSLLSTEEIKLNEHHCHLNENEVDCVDHTESIKPINNDNALVLRSFTPSRIFRLNNGNARVPDRSSSPCSSATQGDSRDAPIKDKNIGRSKFLESLGEDDEGEIGVLPWTRRFYEETQNGRWQKYGNDTENTSKDDVMIIRTSTSAATVAEAAVLRRPSSDTTMDTKESTGKNIKTLSSSSSYSNCSALFPMQLHCALSHPSNKCKLALEWLPHGKSWRILRWEALDKILPQFFPECGNSIDVFLDMVEAWGFQRILDGSARYADQGSYFHKYFQLDSPGLCQHMSLHSTAQVAELHEASPLKRSRLMNGCDSASSVKGNDMINRHTTTTDASTFWNVDAREEKLDQLDCRVPPSLPISKNNARMTGYEVSRTQSNRGSRPAAGYRNITRGTTPDRLIHRMHSTSNSYRSNLSNSSSFGSSFEDNDTYNNGYYADISYSRSNAIRGNQQAFSYDSSCNTSEKLTRGSEDLHECTGTGNAGIGKHNLQHRHCAVVDHSSSSTKTIELRRDEDHLRGTSNTRKLSNDFSLGSYMCSYDRSFKTPDRKSSTISCKGGDVIKDELFPQADGLRRKQASANDVNSTSKPSVVTPSSVVRPISLCSSRGGKSNASASYTPALFSNEVENGPKPTVFNVSRRGSFAKRVLTTKSNYQTADDQSKMMLTFH